MQRKRIPDWVKGYPQSKGYYLLEEWGEKERLAIPKDFWVTEGATCGTVSVYDSAWRKLTDNTIYKSSKGYFIKKNGKRVYLQDFGV